jgi:hypothetical protein
LQEKIEAFEDLVQSVDIACFNKIWEKDLVYMKKDLHIFNLLKSIGTKYFFHLDYAINTTILFLFHFISLTYL